MSTPASPVHIAILDDHKLFRQGIIYIVQQFPYAVEVTEAATLPELLVALSQQQPDVLLLDMQMPEVDGMEAAERLLKQYPDLKIIVLSMHSTDQFIVHMLKLGARTYLSKDVDQEQLRQAIEAIIREGYYFTDSISKAMMRGLHTPSRLKPSFQALLTPLTPRELEVLRLLCQGDSTTVIAQKLFISGRTVEGHRKNLLEKTNTHNSISLVRYAIRHGLLTPSDVDNLRLN